MERFLLFDAGCVACRQLAHSIEHESNGWLSVHSLRESAMQSLLNKANASRQWKPTLIEVQGEDIRVFTGLRLELRLLIGLGPQRAWHIAQMAFETSSSLQTSKTDSGRRSFFRRGGAALAGIALGLGLGNSVFTQNVHAETLAAASRTTAHIDPSDAVIGQLRQTDVVQRANTHFGTPNWQEVYKVEDHSTHETVHMIPYVSQENSPLVKATFLGIVGFSLQGSEKGFVGQLIHADAETQEFVWLTPDAHHFVTTVAHKDRQVEVFTQDIHSLGAKEVVQPSYNIGCLTTCLYAYRLNTICVDLCDACALTNGFGACAGCYACAGAEYFTCLGRCR